MLQHNQKGPYSDKAFVNRVTKLAIAFIQQVKFNKIHILEGSIYSINLILLHKAHKIKCTHCSTLQNSILHTYTHLLQQYASPERHSLEQYFYFELLFQIQLRETGISPSTQLASNRSMTGHIHLKTNG